MKKVIISEKQLESLVKALRNVNEEHKEGSYMAKQLSAMVWVYQGTTTNHTALRYTLGR